MRRRIAVAVGLALLVTIVATAILRSPAPMSRQPHEPPVPDPKSLERPITARIRALTEAVRAKPFSAEAWGELGICYEVHELLQEALTCYRRAAALDPSDFRWPYFLGFCLEVGDLQAALSHRLRAAALRPDYAPLHVYLGRTLLANEELDRARSHFQRATELDASMISAHMGLAEVALLRDDPEGALAHLARALRLGPRQGQVYAHLAEANRRLGNLDAAEAHLARAGRPVLAEPVPDPVRQEWQYHAGVTVHWRRLRSENYLAEGEPEKAIAEWQALLRADPGVAEAHEQIGRIHHISNRIDQAIAEYELTLEIDPERQKIRNILGALLVGKGQIDRGIRLLRESCAALPRYPRAQLNLAIALRELQRADEAIAVLDRTLTHHPDHLEARFEYGVTLSVTGRMEEAAAALTLVAAADPSWPGVQTTLALALARSGEYGQAVQVLRQALARSPRDGQIVNRLAWLLATCPDERYRDGPESRRLIEPLCRQVGYSNPSLLDTLAAACAESGDFDEAVRYAQRALALLSSGDLAQSRSLVVPLEERLEFYERRQPYHEP